MDANRKMGTVKWFSRIKGYGFIAPDDQEKEIFVHFSGIEGEGYRNLEKGQRVSFVIEDTAKGPQAVAVRAEATEEGGVPTMEVAGVPTMEVAGAVTFEGDAAHDFDDDMDENGDEEPPDLVA
jgi:CspA family cold shock protein